MKQYINVVECAIEHDGKFLVIQHPKEKDAADLFAFPGGKIDQKDEKETYDVFRAAVRREVLEETGLSLKDPIEYVLSSTFTTPNGTHVFNTTFYCRINTTLPNVSIRKGEIVDYAWLTPKEIESKANAAPWLKQYIKVIENYTASK